MKQKYYLVKKISVVFGFIINKSNINFIIHKYLRPSTLFESNSKGKINELYKNKLNENYNKNIINFLIGKCGKIKNSKSIVKIYLNKAEAYINAEKYKGDVKRIKSENIFEDVTFKDEYFVEIYLIILLFHTLKEKKYI